MTADTVADAVRIALDDCRIRLGPRTAAAFVDRLAELLLDGDERASENRKR